MSGFSSYFLHYFFEDLLASIFYVTNFSFSSLWLFSSSEKRKKNFFLLIEASTLALQMLTFRIIRRRISLFTGSYAQICNFLLSFPVVISCLRSMIFREHCKHLKISTTPNFFQMLTVMSTISGKYFSSENLSFLQILRYIAQLETSIPL